MYSKTDKTNKSTTKPTILQVAQQIEDDSQTRNEALSILNAYRKIQNMNVPKSNIPQKKVDQSKSLTSKPQSSYANKVKQTLKQLNANRKKELEPRKQIEKTVPISQNKTISPAIRNLLQSGLKRLIKVLQKKCSANMKDALQKINKKGNLVEKNVQQKINYWKLKRLFAGWQYQTVLSKIEKQRQQKQAMQKQKKQMSLAIDFNYFWTIKKMYKKWIQQTKKALKKRQLEFQQNLRREQQSERIRQLNQNQFKRVQKHEATANVVLQNKIRGFLDGLKHEIQSKDRLNTIKQKTQNSNIHQNPIAEEELHTDQQQQLQIGSIENNEPNQQYNENQYKAVDAQHTGPLTNDDLQKRRKQLQKKAKQRKQALDKLKKAKQQKKKQQQDERLRIQKQIQLQQKKLRQQQYRKFLKQKKQQQEWEAKEKELTKQAIQFDSLRLKKYYGWIYWVKLKQTNKQKLETMHNILNKIVMRIKLEQFVEAVTQIGEEKIKNLQQKMRKYYNKKLSKRCLIKIKNNKNNQLSLKQQLSIRHSINTVKIYLNQWKRVRNTIQLQNYQWERPRSKKAEYLHNISLLHKVFTSLKLNRDQQIQNRNIQQNKKKIKQKVHTIVEEQSTINYDDFL